MTTIDILARERGCSTSGCDEVNMTAIAVLIGVLLILLISQMLWSWLTRNDSVSYSGQECTKRNCTNQTRVGETQCGYHMGRTTKKEVAR